MDSEWIKKILQDKEAQRELARQTSEMAKRGISSAQELFTRLKDQVKKDTEVFNREFPLAFHFTPSKKFTVRRGTFPTITLDVVLEEGLIACRRTEKKSADANAITTLDEKILVISDSSADQAYFSIDGEQHRDEASVSEFLLAPIFLAVP